MVSEGPFFLQAENVSDAQTSFVKRCDSHMHVSKMLDHVVDWSVGPAAESLVCTSKAMIFKQCGIARRNKKVLNLGVCSRWNQSAKTFFKKSRF